MADVRRYARLSRRLQANCIDVAVAFHTPLAGICLVTWFGGPLGGPLAALLALTPLVLQPILVARTGSTVGHRLFGLRVVDISTGRPPGLLPSFARRHEGRLTRPVAVAGHRHYPPPPVR